MKFVGWSAGQSGRFSVGQAGLSLLEVLVSAFIVGIASVGLALMFSSGQAFVSAEGDNRVALFLGQQRMEQVRAIVLGSTLVPNLSKLVPNPTNATDAPVEVVDPATAVPCGYLQSPQLCPPAPPVRYTRKTSVVCVSPTDFTARVACPSPLQALRITVKVETPDIPKASPITIETVLAEH